MEKIIFVLFKIQVMAAYVNNVMIIRHELVARLIRMFQAGELELKINALPVELYPKDRNPRGRCCIYKERAITRYKMLPLLGYRNNFVQHTLYEVIRVEEVEEAIYNQDLTDVADVLVGMMKAAKEEEEQG